MTLRQLIAALAVALTLAAPKPAVAHHGYAGPVRLYLQDINLEDQGESWVLHAALNDSGNGRAAPGFVIHATGTGPGGATFGPVTLADPDADGRYESAVGPLPTGDWSLTLDVTDAPGSEERSIPIKRTWPVTLVPGQTADVLGHLPAPTTGEPSGPSNTIPLMLAITTTLAALALAARQFARRRTPTVPTDLVSVRSHE